MSRKKDYFISDLIDLVFGILGFLLIGFILWAWQNKEKAKFYGYISLAATLVLALIVIVAVILVKKHNKKVETNYFNDNEIMAMFRGLTPNQFEEKVAEIFSGMGYKTELSGGPHDGGVDIVAHKDGKKYYIQCKRYVTKRLCGKRIFCYRQQFYP